jgi:SAM-dependent methyltransferase
MTTIPPEQSAARVRQSHEYREVAESFGTDAERYHRTRPSYPSALVERIVAESPGPDVLDVGCGTGIVARLFKAAGCRVLGVDPDARMAEHARERGLEVEVAKIEDWDPAGRQFDVVVAGQAWHWVDPVGGAAKAAQALRPGGRLAVFWNAFQFPAEMAEAFAAAYRRAIPDLPMSRSGMPGPEIYATMCAKAADGMREAGGFGEAQQWRFDWDRPYTRDEWLDQVPTFGGHSRLPPDTLQQVLDGMGAAIDAAGGRFTMHYATMAATAARSGADRAGGGDPR